MTVQTTHPHPISTRTVAAAFAGAVLAASAGYGVAALVLDEAPAPADTGRTSRASLATPIPPTGCSPAPTARNAA